MELGIGLRIKNRRIELGLSQKQLAHKMGYKSEAAISKVEHGEDNITTDRVSKFANALECSPGYLMGWEEEYENNQNTSHSHLLVYAAKMYEMYQKASPEIQQAVDALLKLKQ